MLNVKSWGSLNDDRNYLDDLRYVNVPLVSSARCKQIYGEISNGITCAGDTLEGGKGFCHVRI